MQTPACALALGAEPSVPYDNSGDGVATVTAYPAFMTVEEFEIFPFPDGKVELVRGEPRVMSPAGAPHAKVGMNLLRRLLPFVEQHRLGELFFDGLGYRLVSLPHTVRTPDLSFIRRDRLPAGGLTPGFPKMAPDLAVEVLSPSETARELAAKLDDYLAAGTALIWVINPERRNVQIFSPDAPVRSIGTDDTLDGGSVLPGFSCPVAALFEGLAP